VELDATMLRWCAEECSSFLDPSAQADWSTPIPDMSWKIAEAVAHMGQPLLWYSSDFAAGPSELSSVEMQVDPNTDPVELIRTVRTSSRVLAGVVETLEPGARGWHPAGLADASGFVGMACDELLVHTADAARGLHREFTPPPELAEATLRRLFPWAPTDADPWPGLSWANGRTELPGHGRLSKWRWHCAPLSEWDGIDPSVPI
jgi:uncharacterized protein (TIGR03083 family)